MVSISCASPCNVWCKICDINELCLIQDAQGFTALQLAAQNRHVETVAKLLDSAGTKEEKGYTALHLAVQVGNGDLVRQLLALPTCDPAAKDVDGLTALHWAASKGDCTVRSVSVSCGLYTSRFRYSTCDPANAL